MLGCAAREDTGTLRPELSKRHGKQKTHRDEVHQTSRQRNPGNTEELHKDIVQDYREDQADG